MKEKLLKFLPYALVALVSSALTLCCVFLTLDDADSKLEELENLILEKFIGEADQAAMEDAAAEAMVDSLEDRWSYYMSAETYEAYQEQMANSYVGIGVTIQLREDEQGLDVIAVTKGGAAEAAGLLAGDVIIAVDGQSIAGMSANAVRNLIRGETGSQVSISVRRGEETVNFEVTRAQIKTPVATAVLLEGNIGLVTIENFDSRCAEETIAAVKGVLAQGAEKLIFDVRNNPGGYQKELVKVLDYLLPEGLIFRSEYYNGKVSEDYSDAACVDVPMAVLINGNSYSAAEFFAAALSEYEKAVLVGQATSGKGYFQSAFELSDGSAVNLSIGKYYTPKGANLAGVGLTPDATVEVSDEIAAKIYASTLAPLEDPQILAAIAALADAK